MKQAVLSEPKRFEIRDIKCPIPGKDEVLLKIRALGICGSDIHGFYGKHAKMKTPLVLGHEATGEVVKLGEEVIDFHIGDRVLILPQTTCEKCEACIKGYINICKDIQIYGVHLDGASCEYFKIHSSLIYKLPDSIEFGEGTIIEPLAVAVHALKKAQMDINGKNILVLGAGTIGNLTAQTAKAMGAKSVMITDISDFRLGIAREGGIDHCVNVNDIKLSDAVNEYFNGEYVDLILECSANDAALNDAIDIAKNGSTIVIVGVFEYKPETDMEQVQFKELCLIGTLAYTVQDYIDAIDIAESSKISLSSLITQKFPLVEIQKAYDYIDKNNSAVQKVILYNN